MVWWFGLVWSGQVWWSGGLFWFGLVRWSGGLVVICMHAHADACLHVINSYIHMYACTCICSEASRAVGVRM